MAWDGMVLLMVKKLSSSDYWFVVNLVDNTGTTQVYKGHFSLVR